MRVRFALLSALLLAVPALAQDLAPHRAIYTLSLERARGDIAAARGSMAFELLDACDGWTVRQRLALVITSRDGQNIEMVSEYATWESKDGRRLRFRMRQTTDGAEGERTAGDAELTDQGGEVRYSQPVASVLPLPRGTILPTAHTIAAIRAAQAGQRILSLPLFDGTSDEGAQDSTTAIATALPPQEHAFPDLAPLPSWRMRIAFFNRDGSGQPEYEVGLRYFVNGVADDLQMDFSEFVVRGRMAEFAIVPGGC